MENQQITSFKDKSRDVINISIDNELQFDLATVNEYEALENDEKDILLKYLGSKPLDLWTYADTAYLIQAVRISTRLTRILDTIDAEGYMLLGSTGETMVANPLFRIYHTLLTSYGTIMNRLQLTPAARGESTSTLNSATIIDSPATNRLIPRG